MGNSESKLCHLCGSRIGFTRSLVDQQYCSASHRRAARLASVKALRHEDDDLELWSVSNAKKKVARSATTAQRASVVAILTVGSLLVFTLIVSKPGGMNRSVSMEPGTRQGLFQRAGNAIGAIIRSSAPVAFQTDFQTGLDDWTTVAPHGSNKSGDLHKFASAAAPNLVSPGSLRLWKRSISLVNYQMEFQGQIKKKGLSWAFRATDQNNYYASKILITKPGLLPNAGLVRYAVVNGREWDRVQLPLPLVLERGGKYVVRVNIQDDHFITYVNGQVVSSWIDQRLRRGGVGFFSDEDDAQQVAWVSLSERDSFLGRMLTHFSLFVAPGAAK
jgi:hypothetical protein